MNAPNRITKENDCMKFENFDIQIPNCACHYGYCCAECIYMSRTDYDRYGNAWCGSFRKYYDPSGNVCSRFVRR